jgi:hypothetical protein
MAGPTDDHHNLGDEDSPPAIGMRLYSHPRRWY